MIYIKTNKEEKLCYRWEEVHNYTFSPEVEIIAITDFKVRGKTYQEKQLSLRDQAILWSYADFPLSWGEAVWIANYFYKNGKRYGLLKEFKENGIC
ncbi:hypothetical protein J6S88_00990 [bacterium]|nr:hypothetical protein [bacterium]